MDDDFLRCQYCGGDPFEPDHDLHCDGRQGHVEEQAAIPRFRETSALSFYNAVNSGLVNTLQRYVWATLRVLGPPSTISEIHRHMRNEGSLADSRSVSPRLAELRDLGVVRECGERECRITGQTCLTWAAITLEDYHAVAVVKHRCHVCGQLMRRTKTPTPV
jgi:hypothetical protein